MLEEARKKGASVFVYLIFCLLIVIFVINFGPQRGQDGGCRGSSNVVISVDGKETTQSSYHIAYANPYNRGTGKQHTYVALETLIRRELLAQEAERRGLRANDDLVMDAIKKGYFFLGGQRFPIPGIFTEDGFWNQNAFRGWVGQLNVSRNSYIQEQQRGLLAALMSQILQGSVQVSRDEALSHYLFENNTVQYDVVAFRPEPYRAAMKLTDADVERFLSTHAAEVEARYKADERTYKGTKPQLKLREIFIAKAEEPKPEAPAQAPRAPEQGSAAGAAAGSAAGSAAPVPAKQAEAKPEDAKQDLAKKKDAAKPAAGMKIEEAKAKLEAVRAAAEKDKQKFIDAAKTLNTDEALKSNAGDLGWRSADNAMLGDKAVTDAVKALEPGKMTPVITTDRGAYLILAEAKREGDLSFDQVKHEIAKELARDVWSKEAAKRAAIAALDKARSGTGLNLEQLYDKQQAPTNPGIDIQQLLEDPNIPPEQKQKILEMLQQGGRQGSIVWESEDVPASWTAQADGAGGGSAASKPADVAKPADAAKPATGTAPATAGSPAGSVGAAASASTGAGSAASASAPAAGSAASTSAPAAPAAGSATAGAPAAGGDKPAAEVTPSNDKLPEFGEVPKPTVARFGPAPRSLPMAGIGSSKEAAAALFDELTPGMLAKRVYEADGAYVVLQLISRSQPKFEDVERDADRRVEELRAERAQAFVEQWMKERCEKLAKDGKIKANPGLLRETDDKGNPIPSGYRPCMSFR